MERNSMLLLHEHSEFSSLVTWVRASACLVLHGEIKLARHLTFGITGNVFSLRETVRFYAHLLTGISKK